MTKRRPVAASRPLPVRVRSNNGGTLLFLLMAALAAFGLYMMLRGRSGSLASNTHLSNVFTPEVQHWSPLIYAWSSAYNVDPNLIATVIQIESCGDPNVVSGSGAQGLFQVMPFHFKPGEDMLDVVTNGARGMDYLASGLEQATGDIALALAGYNGGHGVIGMNPARWPQETQRYAQWGTGIYTDASRGLTTSPTLTAWLQAGGERLCKAASVTQLVAGG
jgi:soluble lytic murein transglycosylase-like protein